MARRRRPPWGDILGNPIERLFPISDERHGQASDNRAKIEQHGKMLRLAEFYGVDDSNNWYQVALAIATDLDEALRITDPPPPPTHKTAPRWRGIAGRQLILDVEGLEAEHGPDVSRDAIFEELRELDPERYGKMSAAHIKTAYHEAIRTHQTGAKRPER